MAANLYYANKARKYRGSRHKFIPFIIETGGRLHDKARDFIDDSVDERVEGQRGMRTKIFKALADALHYSQSYMLAAHIRQLRENLRDR